MYLFSDEVVEDTDGEVTLGATLSQHQNLYHGPSVILPGVRVLGLKGAAFAAFGERPKVFFAA